MIVKRAIIFIIPFISLLLLIGCGGDLSADEDGIRVSGFIEGRDYTIASALGGRVVEVLINQGERVEAGQTLVRLDRTALDLVYDAAQAGVTAAEAALIYLEAQPQPVDLVAAQASLDAAEAGFDAAEAALDLLTESYKPFKPPEVELHAAESAVEVARAGVDLAKAQLDQVEAGSFEGEIEIAQAAVEETKANLRLVEYQLAELSLEAPVTGIVSQIVVNVGEVAAPGTPLGTVLDPSFLTLTVYVPEAQVAKISAGDAVEIRVDAYPEEVFNGRVSYIANQAQFTPTEVQTQEERVKLVFAVEILLDDPDGRLKPGMPADAVITP
ncbi:MAG TPA: HlyD family efflux transporter periplasmic adaptor subunit [Anaerolineae bacterium]|nr:HlyD family efflux transporter periplasmic adaptor subunit [Anaerolineae bacterium]